MKRSVRLMGILLLLLIAGNGCHYAKHSMKGKMDNTRMSKSGRGMDFRQMRGMGPGRMGQFMAQAPMRGNRGFLRYGRMQGMRGNNWPAPMYGMRSGMGQGPDFRMGRGMGPMAMGRMGQGPMGPGRMMIDRIPNLTDKQKKDIADLRQKQQDEMKKFSEEMSAKMKSMRESNRDKMLKLLTDEQKKFVESGSENTNPAPSKVK